MVPIGDNFTMGIEDVLAALDLLTTKLTVPMHYNTWPVIAVDVEAFAKTATRNDHYVKALKPGETLTVSEVGFASIRVECGGRLRSESAMRVVPAGSTPARLTRCLEE